jgi:hypothetical protein
MDIVQLSEMMAKQKSEQEVLLDRLASMSGSVVRQVVVRTAISGDTTDPWGASVGSVERNPK